MKRIKSLCLFIHSCTAPSASFCRECWYIKYITTQKLSIKPTFNNFVCWVNLTLSRNNWKCGISFIIIVNVQPYSTTEISSLGYPRSDVTQSEPTYHASRSPLQGLQLSAFLNDRCTIHNPSREDNCLPKRLLKMEQLAVKLSLSAPKHTPVK